MGKGNIAITAIAIAILVTMMAWACGMAGLVADELGFSDKAQA